MIRTKTIEYSLSSSRSAVTSSVARIFNPLIVYIPETGSREFTSCFIEYYAIQYQTVVTDNTGWKFNYKVGSGPAYSESTTRTITNTGEHQSFIFVHDVTNAFSSSFSSTDLSQSFLFQSILTGSNTNNASAKLVCTYNWDDAAQIRIKTITIPMDSGIGTASATGSGEFMDTIPALDTYLPEANKTIRQVSFEWIGNTHIAATASNLSSCSFALDNNPRGLAENSTSPFITTLITANYFKYNWIPPSIDTSTTHSIWIKSSDNRLPMNCISPKCIVTYEYDHASSSKVMNCMSLVAAGGNGIMGGNTEQFRSRASTEFSIQEPQITMSRCGTYFSTSDTAGVIFRPSVTSGNFTQSVVTYTFPAAVHAGMFVASARFDSGSRGGVGIDLRRGINRFTLDWYTIGTTAGVLGSNFTALTYFNYESGKSSMSGGDANHNHVVKQLFSPIFTTNLVQSRRTSSLTFADTSSYWLTSNGMCIYIYSNSGNGFAVLAMATGSTGESYANFGWKQAFACVHNQDAEMGNVHSYIGLTDQFKQSPSCANISRLDATRHRPYTIDQHYANAFCGYFIYSYHTIDYVLTGSVSGSTGDGSGIPIKFFRADTDDLVAETTTSVGGSFRKVWYDNTNALYATARESDTKVGRSANMTASGMP